MESLLYTGVLIAGFIIGKVIRKYITVIYSVVTIKFPCFELLTAVAFYFNVYTSGFSLRFIEFCSFSLFIFTIGFIDFHLKIIPNKIVCLFVAVNLIFSIINCIVYSESILNNLIGVVSASAILFVISFLSNGSIGGGDIKFSAAAGIFLGWMLSILALAVAVLLAGVILTVLLLVKKVDKKDVIALGPFLAVGMYVAMLLL